MTQWIPLFHRILNSGRESWVSGTQGREEKNYTELRFLFLFVSERVCMDLARCFLVQPSTGVSDFERRSTCIHACDTEIQYRQQPGTSSSSVIRSPGSVKGELMKNFELVPLLLG